MFSYRSSFRLAVAPAVLLILVTGSGPAQCTFDWTPGFGQRGVSGGISALHVCDLGSGPQLYTGGGLERENGVMVNHIARWTGSSWAPVGLGMNADVRTFASVNLGSGYSLYAGGNFTLLEGQPSFNVARWNGTSWSSTSYNGSEGGRVGIKVWPGPPAALYGINGHMLSIMTANTWLPVATVTPTESLTALEVFDDGTGPHVYVAGTFTTVNGVPLNRVAKWTGSAWAPLGSGMNDWVSSLAVYDDGTGPALYAGGSFTTAGDVPALHLAKWNGQSWSAVGGGLANGSVDTLSVQDWGSGPKLLVSGYFTSIGPGVPANFLASWNGSAWAAFGAGLSSAANAFAVLNDGSGPSLIVGGGFISAGGDAMNYIARWDGAAWHPMPDGNGFNSGSFDFSWVQASTVWDDGTGPALYLGGRFKSVGNCAASKIVKFDGRHWTALGSGMDGDVYALAGYDSGTGPMLYAGGFFSQAGGVAASNIAKWNGTQWSPLGSGLPFPCYSLEPITTGFLAGTLAVGGHFLSAGGVFAPFIAFWNGSYFTSTSLVTSTYPLVEQINAIAAFDDGTGPAIYAGGRVCCGGWPSLWKFNGSSWTPSGTNSGTINDLEVFDSGTGPKLYAAGETSVFPPTFSFAELTPAGWVPVPGSLPTTAVHSLRIHQDESGTALYLGGETFVPGLPPAYLVRWDGTSFSSLGTGPGGLGGAGASNQGPVVNTLASFDDGTGPALYAAGCFTQAGPYLSNLVGRWAAQRPTLSLSQSIPGAGVVITNTGLLSGHLYHNIFSLELCAQAGSGPYIGLCATDPTPLLDQFYLPLGAAPFHFAATAPTKVFGPYAAPAGITFDGVTFDYTGGVLGCHSMVRRFTIQ